MHEAQRKWDSRWNAEPSADYRAFLEAETTRIFSLHPQLQDAVPPVHLERVDGTFSLSPAKLFSELAQGHFQLRAPADIGLVGPFRGTGTCLDPLTVAGCMYWVDPALPAQDGDLVVVMMKPEALAGIVERNQDNPEWLATYGARPGPLVTKLLKRLCADYYLVTNASALPLGDNKIVGVVRRIERDGQSIYGEPVHHIGQNAATVSIETTDATHTSATGNFGIETVVSYVTSAIPSDHTITCTWSCDVWTTSPTARIMDILVAEGGGAHGPWYTADRTIVATATPGERVQLQVNVPALVGLTYTVSGVIASSGGGATGVVEVRNSSLLVEHIKR